MDKYERRRLRLIELIKTQCNGVAAEFARRIERDASYVARMLYPEGKNGKKRIADDMMELIENAYGLPRGYLDAADSTAPAEPKPYNTYPTAYTSPALHSTREEPNHPLVVRYATADAATRALVDIALGGPNDPLPPGLSPAMRTLVDMARAAIRAEQTKY